jgi:rubrerythrin
LCLISITNNPQKDKSLNRVNTYWGMVESMVDKKKFRCGTCNWKFTRNYSPNLCPYCGKATVEEDFLPAADQLVQNI